MQITSIRNGKQVKNQNIEKNKINSLLEDIGGGIKKGILIATTLAVLTTSNVSFAQQYNTETVYNNTTSVEQIAENTMQSEIDSMMVIKASKIDINGNHSTVLNMTSEQMKTIKDANGIENVNFSVNGDVNKEDVIKAFNSTSSDDIQNEDFSFFDNNQTITNKDNTAFNIVINQDFEKEKNFNFSNVGQFIENHELAHAVISTDKNAVINEISTQINQNIDKNLLQNGAYEHLNSGEKIPYKVYLEETFADVYSLVKYSNEHSDSSTQKLLDDVKQYRTSDLVHYSNNSNSYIYDYQHNSTNTLNDITLDDLKINGAISTDKIYEKTSNIVKDSVEKGNVLDFNDFTVTQMASIYINPAVSGALKSYSQENVNYLDSQIHLVSDMTFKLPPEKTKELLAKRMKDFFDNDYSTIFASQRHKDMNDPVMAGKIQNMADKISERALQNINYDSSVMTQSVETGMR